MVEDLNLVDAWRNKHTNERQYTFYSEAKKSAGRIDGLWISNSLMTLIKKTEIQPKSISDHNLITLELRDKKKMNKQWRMNERILNDEKII